MNADTSLMVVLLLGAIHGLNPAMGWLFAVSLGLQEQRRSAVWRAFGPLALGHALAIVATLAAAALIGIVVSLNVLKWVVAGALTAMGLLQLFRHWHPRVGGMRIGARDLVLWSFLMASAHGAGLMVLPFLLPDRVGRETRAAVQSAAHAAHAMHGGHAAGGGISSHLAYDAPAEHAPPAAVPPTDRNRANGSARIGLAGTVVHTGGYLLAAALLALIVYELVGVRVLRRAWINVNLFWALALIVTGALTPFL